jgi:hypothetical protein
LGEVRSIFVERSAWRWELGFGDLMLGWGRESIGEGGEK